jgi:hypothetical protein
MRFPGHRWWPWFIVWVVSIIGAAGVVSAAGRDFLARLTSSVNIQTLRQSAAVLGSDALEGRAPGTPGGNRAARFIEQQLRSYGLESILEDGQLMQQVPLHGIVPLTGTWMQLESLGNSLDLDLWDDYVLFSTGEQTLVPELVPMVFVGYGIIAPEFDYNDYADLDVAGKIVVYLDGEPPSTEDDFFDGSRPTVYSSLEAKKRMALSRGARGGLLVPVIADGIAAAWQRTRFDFEFEDLSLAYAVPGHLSAILHPDRAEWLFSDALYDWDQVRRMASSGIVRSFHLPVRLRFEGRFRTRDVLSPNVVAALPGRDPRFRDTAVVVSAHYDHLGIGPEIRGDSIYNGVVDNALGVAGVLEIARVLAGLDRAPRRTVIFLLTTAEEEGLLGTQFFLDHPPLPRSKMAANINVDGLAFNDTFDSVIGVGAELSTLGRSLDDVAGRLGLEIERLPDLFWDAESFARSDQKAFAERGVPSILVNEGFQLRNLTKDEAIRRNLDWLSSRYHTPFDDLQQPLNWSAVEQHCQVVLALVYTLAEDPNEPEWYQGTTYLYERLVSRALGE